jgi:radical SAM protein with 4Fe4S-binding SPASM domain
MSLSFFKSILPQIKTHTNEVACHLMGDPFTLSNLSSYLELLHHYKLKAHLTTSGYYMHLQTHETLFHPAVKQLNISLNAYNKNTTDIPLESYLEPIVKLAKKKVTKKIESFINFRVWNLNDTMSDKVFNQIVLKKLGDAFGIALDVEEIYIKRPKQIRLAPKVLLHFDDYFEWPSLDNENYGEEGYCLGLKSHIGILSDGRVVPCCLDGKGIIDLGNLHQQTLHEILQGERASHLREGFQRQKAVEELCQKCSYKERFL